MGKKLYTLELRDHWEWVSELVRGYYSSVIIHICIECNTVDQVVKSSKKLICYTKGGTDILLWGGEGFLKKICILSTLREKLPLNNYHNRCTPPFITEGHQEHGSLAHINFIDIGHSTSPHLKICLQRVLHILLPFGGGRVNTLTALTIHNRDILSIAHCGLRIP